MVLIIQHIQQSWRRRVPAIFKNDGAIPSVAIASLQHKNRAQSGVFFKSSLFLSITCEAVYTEPRRTQLVLGTERSEAKSRVSSSSTCIAYKRNGFSVQKRRRNLITSGDGLQNLNLI